jgi:uncharacterized protein (TIRG00374 family)
MVKRLAQLTAGMLISALLITLVARTVDFDKVASALRAADFRLIFVAVGVHMLAMLVRSVLWRRLLAAEASTGTLFKASIVGFAVSYILPLRIGEVARAYLLARWRSIPYGTSFASLVAERVLDGLAVGAIILAALLFVAAPPYVLALALIVGCVFGGLGLALIVMSWRAGTIVAVASSLGRWLPTRARKTGLRLAHGFADGLRPLRDWRALPWIFGLCVVGWLGQFAVFYLIMAALAIPASLPDALLTGGVANFATLLPSAPGSVGTYDAAIVKLLSDVDGIALDQAAAYALTVHVVVVVPIVLLGAFIMWRSRLTLSQMFSRTQHVGTSDSAGLIATEPAATPNA